MVFFGFEMVLRYSEREFNQEFDLGAATRAITSSRLGCTVWAPVLLVRQCLLLIRAVSRCFSIFGTVVA